MNTEFFLARRLVSGNRSDFSWTFVVIAIASITLGVAIMFIAIAILTGFKKEIREKVIGFSGHIQINSFAQNSSYEPRPVSKFQPFLPGLKRSGEIRHIQVYASKAGIIKTKDQILGVLFKGVGKDYDWSFFNTKMLEGRTFRVSDTGRCDEVIVSRKTASLLNLKVHDDLRMYFAVGDNILGRKLTIAGIYDTGLEDFDKLYVIGDIHHIRRLNGWSEDQVGGFEVILRDFNDMEKMGARIYREVGFNLDASTIRQLYPQIFDWLDLQDINVLIILILIFLVSATTIISTLLILILERTAMIGTLKALGMRTSGVRKVFLYNALFIAGTGMLLGNLLAFSLCLLQKYTGLVTLPEDSYYVPVIPIHLDLWNILLLNTGTLVTCYLIFLLPSFIIARVVPVKAIRYR